jgi:hypothetical protein
MATQPQPPARPAPAPPAPTAAKPPVAEPVKTVAEEQRERSEAMQAQGVEAFKASHDERDPNERPRSVAGVGARQAAGEAERSTPPARAAQNKASP